MDIDYIIQLYTILVNVPGGRLWVPWFLLDTYVNQKYYIPSLGSSQVYTVIKISRSGQCFMLE